MQVTCEKCSAKYNIGDDKIKASGTAVRCPKCQHVFKVFPASDAPAQDAVACANCGKSTPSVAGQAVVFCQECQTKLAGGGAAPADDPFAGANLFGDAAPASGGGLFDDAPAAPASGGGLFDDAPAAPASGGGLFDDAPAAPASGGGLFDDEPAAPASGGGLFDDEPAAPASGGGLFDDEPAAPASGGGLFDDEPAAPASGGGLFDDEPAPAGGAAADPFGDFDEPAGGISGGNAADPFADFGAPPEEDDMGFQEPADEGAAAAAPPPSFDDEEEAAPAPVRAKAAHQFKKQESTPKDKLLDFFGEHGRKIAVFGGGSVVVMLLAFVAALAFMPASFDARPTRPDDKPGFLARSSFSLQKLLKSSYYGKAMEAAFISAGDKAAAALSGAGFTLAEKEYRELLAFDPNNAAAKGALLKLYSTWDIVEETQSHGQEINQFLAAAKDDGARAWAMLAVGKHAEAKEFGAKSADASFISAAADYMAGGVTGAVEDLRQTVKAKPAEFMPNLLLARALRDAKQYQEAVSAYSVAANLVKGNAKAQLETGRIFYGPLSDEEKAYAAFSAVLTPQAGASERLKAEALYYLAHILHRRGNGTKAIENIQAALAIEKNNPKYLVMLGDIQFDSGKVVDAFNAYDQAVKADPKYVDGYVGLGRANERLEKQALALQNFKQAIATEPGNMRANFLYASLVLRQGNKDEAEQILTQVLEQNPNNVEAIGHLASFYAEQNRQADALAQYARVIELAPHRIDGYIGRGAVLLKQGDVNEAKRMFEQAAAIETSNPAVLFRLGQATFLQGDYATAGSSLQTALLKDPYHWEAHLYMGMNHFRTQKFEEALVEFQKTIDINPRAAEAYRQRALVYLAQSQAEGSAASKLLEKAASDMQSALYYNKDNPEYLYDQGLVFEAAGLEGKAKDAWLKAKELRPGYKEAMFKLANYYVSFTDYGNAEAILKELLKSSPKNADAYLGMGKVYQAKGDLEQAYRVFARAAQLDPKSADAQNLMGETFDQQGLTDQAFVHFQKALRLNPKHGEAHFNMGLYWKDRDKNKSTASFKAAIDSGVLSKVKREDAQTLLRELEYLK